MSSRRGVTLIELLVAMGILALLVVILYSVFSVSLRAWKKADNIFKSTAIARIVLDRMSREISSAIIKDDNSYYLLGIDSSNIGAKKTDSIGDEIYFIAALNPGINAKSDLCEVGFWLDGQATGDSSDDVLRRFYAADGRKTSTGFFDFNFATGTSHELSGNITDLQFTFYDSAGGDFNSWNSKTDGVPSKIEVFITVQMGMGTQATNTEYYTNSYTTTISLLR